MSHSSIKPPIKLSLDLSIRLAIGIWDYQCTYTSNYLLSINGYNLWNVLYLTLIYFVT